MREYSYMTAISTGKKPVEAARALAPLIRAHADEIERERRLPPVVVQAMAEADLFRMLVPAYLGGPETDLPTFARAVEEIARADGSAAWCLGQGAGCAVYAARLARDAALRIWGNPYGVVAAGVPLSAPTAVAVEGGYRLTGAWRSASGMHNATWLAGRHATVIHPDGTPRILPNGAPEQRILD